MDALRRRHLGFQLRLSDKIRDEAIRWAEREGVSLNQFISLAVAEKLAVYQVRRERAQHDARTRRPGAGATFTPTRTQ